MYSYPGRCTPVPPMRTLLKRRGSDGKTEINHFFTSLDLSLQKLPSIAAGCEIRSETSYHKMTVFGFPLDGLLNFDSWRKDVTVQSRTTFSSSPPASVSRGLGLKGNILTLFFFFLLEHTLKLVSLLRNNVSVGNLEMVAKEIAQ